MADVEAREGPTIGLVGSRRRPAGVRGGGVIADLEAKEGPTTGLVGARRRTAGVRGAGGAGPPII